MCLKSDPANSPPGGAEPRGFDRLMSLAHAREALLCRLAPVTVSRRPLASALGLTLAEDLRAARSLPSAEEATRDGYAVASRETVGAAPHAPSYVAGRLPVVWAGDALAAACDAVLSPEAVVQAPGSGAEILQAVAPGAGTRERGHDLGTGAIVARAGQRLRADQVAVLAMAGAADVAVRLPRLHVEGGGPLAGMVEALASGEGAAVGAACEADATLILAGAGQAATAAAMRPMAVEGRVLAHGLALQPGEAIGLGLTSHSDGGDRPVFIVPDRLEEVLAAWLLLIRPALAAMAGRSDVPRPELLPLMRKIVSAPGLAELVLLRRVAAPAGWEPLAVGDLAWSTIALADAYALVPPESEGLPAGSLLAAFAL